MNSEDGEFHEPLRIMHDQYKIFPFALKRAENLPMFSSTVMNPPAEPLMLHPD